MSFQWDIVWGGGSIIFSPLDAAKQTLLETQCLGLWFTVEIISNIIHTHTHTSILTHTHILGVLSLKTRTVQSNAADYSRVSLIPWKLKTRNITASSLVAHHICDHKTSQRGQFFENRELCIIWKLNKSYLHWCMVWTIFENLVQKNLNIDKIPFKVVQMNFLELIKN